MPKLTKQQRDQLIVQQYLAGVQMKLIGEDVGCTRYSVSRVIRRLGLTNRRKSFADRQFCVKMQTDLVEWLDAEAREFGMGRSQMLRKLVREAMERQAKGGGAGNAHQCTQGRQGVPVGAGLGH